MKHEDHRNHIVTECQFDMIRRTVGIDSTDGLKLRNQYDDKNRVAAVTQKLEDSLVKTEYIYGEAEKQQKPGLMYGLKVDGTERAVYTYDLLARQTQKSVKAFGATYNTYYEFLAGPVTGTTTTLLSSIKNGSKTLSYTYDVLGNIQTISEDDVLKCTYHYDELNRLVREDNVWENKTICYTYDLGGNMTSWKEYAYTTEESLEGKTVNKENSYAYGNAVWKDQLTSYNGQAITYDVLGNPLSYRGMTMSWEKGRELKQIVKDGSTIAFAYDTAGCRIGKTAAGVETKYYWSGDKIIGMKKDGDLIHFLYDEKGNLFALQRSGALYYYIFNAQNDVIGLIDSAGKQVVTYTYNSWGKPLSLKDTSVSGVGSKNPFRYRGYCWDDETGFYYVSSRYYDPVIGRFISPDSGISGVGGDIRGYNLYSYCFNNPVNMSDPDGNWPKWVSKIGNAVKNTVKSVVKAVKKAANTVKTTVAKFAKKTSGASNKRPPTGEPGSTYVAPNGDRRTYGPDGKPVHDYDHSDHGNPKNHPHDENGGHHHDWDWTKNPPRQGAYVPNVEMIVGVGLVTVSSIGIAAVALDDLSGIGIADNFLYGPLGAGVSQGLIMIY